MKITEILEADMLDIIFENRNKDYGAYALRKYYHERLYKALGIIFLLISILSVYSLLHKANIVLKDPIIFTSPGYIPKPIPQEKIVSSTTKPKQPIIQKLNSAIFTSVIKFVDSTDRSTKPIKDLTNTAISTVDNNGPGNVKQIVEGTGSTSEGKDSIKGLVILPDRNKPLAVAEFMPSYPGGEDALIKFLQKNLHNPQDLEADQAVSVKIQFIVGYDGTLKGFETVEDGGKAFNNEVIRVLKKMPAWIPGKTAGENVSVYYTIPVKFVSQE